MCCRYHIRVSAYINSMQMNSKLHRPEELNSEIKITEPRFDWDISFMRWKHWHSDSVWHTLVWHKMSTYRMFVHCLLLLHYVGFKIISNSIGKFLCILSIPPGHLQRNGYKSIYQGRVYMSRITTTILSLHGQINTYNSENSGTLNFPTTCIIRAEMIDWIHELESFSM